MFAGAAGVPLVIFKFAPISSSEKCVFPPCRGRQIFTNPQGTSQVFCWVNYDVLAAVLRTHDHPVIDSGKIQHLD